MSKKSILVFMGTRPEAIKLAPVVTALRKSPDFACTVVATGQHKEMFRQVSDQFGLTVDADLDVMRPDQSLAQLTAVLVAALACFYRRIPIGHVEAGLRTGNIWSPFPEEVNRRLASLLVRLHFAPTSAAREALLREGVRDDIITVTGNTVIDALHMEAAIQQSDGVGAAIDGELDGLIGAD